MKASRIFHDLAQVELSGRPLHLAIGMFDGVHLGHQAVIGSAVHSAARSGGMSGVLTFWPHPSALVHPERRTRMMMTPSIKCAVLARLGVDCMIEQSFGPDFAAITADDFLPALKAWLPSLAGVYVGENWRFGAGRHGDVALLLASAVKLGLPVFSTPRVQFNGEPISSTRIRKDLAAGRIGEVNTLLGYTYFSCSESVSGRRLGRTLGFPTINLPWEPELAPAHGVYGVRVAKSGCDHWHPAVANYGLRPTVGEAKSPLLEVHLLAPPPEFPFATGDELVVEWLTILRPERRFADVGELRAQIARDCAAARLEFSLPATG
jgi:riboflavin kinase/FMN adenylyltransferase